VKPCNRSVVRLLLAWLLMFALPFAGHAGTGMPSASGAPAQAHAMAACPHGAHGGAAMAQSSGHAGDLGHHDGEAPGHDAKSCAACCIGAVLAPALPALPRLDRPVSAAIPFFAPHVPSGFPDLPERPPQTTAA
jgi:hypothetical protein